jgi:Trk K+ transport system NAD-binding subunit
MQIKAQHMLQPRVFDADSVVIEDNFGNPILVAVNLDKQTVICAKAGDPDFQELLKTLGINKTVLVRETKPKPIEQVVWTP